MLFSSPCPWFWTSFSAIVIISHKTGWIYQSLTKMDNYVFLWILIFFIFMSFSKFPKFMCSFPATLCYDHAWIPPPSCTVQDKTQAICLPESSITHFKLTDSLRKPLRGWTVNWLSEEQFVMSTSKSDAGVRRPTSIQTQWIFVFFLQG